MDKINAYYKVTKVTSVAKNPDGEKELVERDLVGKHSVKDIKELLSDDETFLSVEYEDKTLSFDLDTFNDLRSQSLI